MGPATITTTPPLTISALHAAYRSGAWRPSQVVEYWLQRPANAHDRPVWITTVAPACLRTRAEVLDRLLLEDANAALSSPVFGALYAVKDNIDVAGLQTTAACPAFAYEAVESAAVVAALERAGAIMVGKTNLDQFATGLVGTRSPYGAVPNAFNAAYISGGSSSGSAVAVAKGWVHFALGTDTAGSGRVPAAFNNIVGWKPTPGFISTHGVVPACRSLDCVSIFALTVADAARVFAVAIDNNDTVSGKAAVDLDRPPLGDSFVFGLPRREQLEFFGDGAAAAAFADAALHLIALGGEPREIDFAPWRAVASTLYEGPRIAERHAAIAGFFDTHGEALDSTVRSIIGDAQRYSASDAYRAQAWLAQQKSELDRVWQSIDVLLVPSVPTIYSLAEIERNPIELNSRLGIYTNFVNLLEQAAIAIPAAIRPDGLPFGVTLIGPAGTDLVLAELGQRLHSLNNLCLGATGAAIVATESLPIRPQLARVAVVGAHLSGLPLNRELTDRGARFVGSAKTAACYRLYALPKTSPPKPGLLRTRDAGYSIAIEVWEMPIRHFGSFVAGIAAPLSIGSIELDDGSSAQGFICEAAAIAGAEDISRYGGWRNYLSAHTAADDATIPPVCPSPLS